MNSLKIKIVVVFLTVLSCFNHGTAKAKSNNTSGDVPEFAINDSQNALAELQKVFSKIRAFDSVAFDYIYDYHIDKFSEDGVFLNHERSLQRFKTVLNFPLFKTTSYFFSKNQDRDIRITNDTVISFDGVRYYESLSDGVVQFSKHAGKMLFLDEGLSYFPLFCMTVSLNPVGIDMPRTFEKLGGAASVEYVKSQMTSFEFDGRYIKFSLKEKFGPGILMLDSQNGFLPSKRVFINSSKNLVAMEVLDWMNVSEKKLPFRTLPSTIKTSIYSKDGGKEIRLGNVVRLLSISLDESGKSSETFTFSFPYNSPIRDLDSATEGFFKSK